MPEIQTHLVYFKELIEGRDVPSWHPWWRSHKEEIEKALGRTDFLKLRFGGVDAAAELLTKHDVSFEWTPKGRREAALARLHPDFVDENGQRKEPLQNDLDQFQLAMALFREGKNTDAQRKLDAHIKRVMKTDPISRAEVFSELLVDGQQLLEEGRAAEAIPLLKAVSRVRTSDDLIQWAINEARELLEEKGIRCSPSSGKRMDRELKKYPPFERHLAIAKQLMYQMNKAKTEETKKKLKSTILDALSKAGSLKPLPEKWAAVKKSFEQ